MVKDNSYSELDCFISIGYTKKSNELPNSSHSFRIKSAKDGFDDPIIPTNPNFLRVKFDDILEDFGENNLAFNDKNAEEILNFLSIIKPRGTIHIHCQMGKSRSVGLGIAIKKLYDELGFEVDILHTTSLIVPNQTVIDVLLKNKKLLTDSI